MYCLCLMLLQGQLPLLLSKVSLMGRQFNGMAFCLFRSCDKEEFIVSIFRFFLQEFTVKISYVFPIFPASVDCSICIVVNNQS